MLNEKEAEVQDFIKEMERKHRMMFLAPEISDNEEEEEAKNEENIEEKTESKNVALDNATSLDELKTMLNDLK